MQKAVALNNCLPLSRYIDYYMNRFSVFIFAAVVCMLLGAETSARTVNGKVTCGQQNLSNVIVTDGFKFVKTKKNGEFKMDVADSARFVYIVTPSGYAGDWSSGAPQFYQKIDERDTYTFDLIKTGDPSERYNIVAVGDPQPSKERHCDEFDGEPLEDLCQTISGLEGPSVGLVLGDVCFNKYHLMARWKKSIVRTGIPFYAVPGNHDHVYEMETDRKGSEVYTEYFGPENYAFFIGKDVVIMLDNIIHGLRARHNYTEGYTEEQLAWVKALLKYIPKGGTVYVGQHSPTNGRAHLSGGKETDLILRGSEFLNLLKGRKVHIISGHNHINMNFQYAPDVIEHNVAAICGTWWDAYHCKDGTPRGYKVYTNKEGILTWYYKSVGKDRDFQHEIFLPGETKKNPESVVVNLWDYDRNWSVTWFEDGVHKGAMKRVKEYNPLHTAEVEATFAKKGKPVTNWKRTTKSNHYFAATPSEGARKITVIISNPFGKEWVENINL